MAKKVAITVRIDSDLKDWMKELTKDKRRGMSGFVEDACVAAKRKGDKK